MRVTPGTATTDAARQISLSTQQQKTASNQVVIALRETMEGSKQTSEAIRQVSAISKQMTLLADNLKSTVETFRLS